jgi:hypothetical protein
MSNFMEIRPVRAELFHAGRRRGRKLIVAFHNFANAPKYLFFNVTIRRKVWAWNYICLGFYRKSRSSGWLLFFVDGRFRVMNFAYTMAIPTEMCCNLRQSLLSNVAH